MADDVVITLSGEAGALIASLKQAADQFTMLRQTMAAGADAAKLFGQTFAEQAQAWLQSSDSMDIFRAKLQYLNEEMALTGEQESLATQAIRDYTDQLAMARQAMSLISDAQEVLGADFAQQSQDWLAAATSADDYAARLAYVREQIAYTQDQMATQNADSQSAMGMLGMLGSFTGGGLSGIVNGLDAAGVLGDLGGPLGALAGGIDGVIGGMGQFVMQSASFVGAMAAWTIIQDVTSWVQQLSSELFNLNVQTEKAYTGWQYLFGGPNNGGKAAATNMMQWTSQYSMGIPFTRQDLMGAITTLSTVGLSPAQIEQFMPTLSDIAATYGSASYGGQGVNLQQAANAIRMLSEGGQSRLLKYDLNINPQELIQYGLKATSTSTGVHITDMNSVFTSLENFAKAKGVSGASGGIVNSTWWGGYSSLVDNIQNTLLNLGGTNLDGTIRKGSFFASIKADLDNLLQWFTDHQGQLQAWSDEVSTVFGKLTGGAGNLTGVFTGFWQGLTSSGVGQTILADVNAAVRWMANPDNQHMLEELGIILGQGIGQSLTGIVDAFSSINTTGAAFLQRMRPQDLALISDAFALISYSVQAAADALSYLSLETLDFVHLSEDVGSGNWSALSGDMKQIFADRASFNSEMQAAWSTATSQDAQMQIAFQQWMMQNPTPPALTRHIRDQHTINDHSGQAAAAAVNTVVNHAHTAHMAQSILDEFAQGLLHAAGRMGDVGQQVAQVIGDAITQHVAEQFRIQGIANQSHMTNMPGGWRAFGVVGAGF